MFLTELPMRRSWASVSLVCPNCKKPVDPSAPDAMMSEATKQWQHTDCWTQAPTPKDPDSREDQASRGESG